MTEKKIKYATIILDTNTEVETILRQATFEGIAASSTKDREKLAPNEYTLRNLRMAALFDQAANAGINLISLQYMKTKWEKDSKGQFFDTGETMIDGWQRTESQADVNIEINKHVATIVSNRFDPTQDGKSYKETTFEELSVVVLGDFLDDDEEYPNLTFSITGMAKSGKTHLAMTAPEPIKVYCFNRGSDFVQRKFPDKHIDVVNYSLPIIDELNPKPWAEPVWNKFYSDFKKTVEESS